MATDNQESTDKNIEIFSEIIDKYGQAIMKKTVNQTLNYKNKDGPVSRAIKYHSQMLPNVLPVLPALVGLSCEAAGGTIEKCVDAGAALTLFVEASNIHDDLIDQTLIKRKRKTVLGKFGSDVTLLAGDVLLVQAALSLSQACQKLANQDKERIINLTYNALIEISKSAANESAMKRRLDASSRDYLEVIRLRASVPEAHCMTGAIIAGASANIVSCLGNYGRTHGIAGTVIDEFMDFFDYSKFSARLKNECVPLPLLCAMKDPETKGKVKQLLTNFEINKDDFKRMAKLVSDSKQVLEFRNEIMNVIAKSKLEIHKNLKESIARRDLATLLIVLENLLCSVDRFTNRLL